MLKAKEMYTSESTHARHFFTHKGICQDFQICPMVGSIIRVVTPHPDQPTYGAPMYTKPQMLFITPAGFSRMFSISGAGEVMAIATVLKDSLMGIKDNATFEIANKSQCGLTLTSDGDVTIKNGGNVPLTFIYGRATRNDTETKEKYRLRTIRCLERVIAAMHAIYAGKGPDEEIIKENGMFMTSISRSDRGCRTPIIIRGKSKNDIVEGGSLYFSMWSNQQRFVFQQAKNVKAIDTVNSFMGLAGMLAEQVIEDGIDRVAPLTTYDSNMEYVNAKWVNWESGDHVHLTLNSDRFPANTKFQYVYDRVEHVKLHRRLQQFVQAFTA